MDKFGYAQRNSSNCLRVVRCLDDMKLPFGVQDQFQCHCKSIHRSTHFSVLRKDVILAFCRALHSTKMELTDIYRQHLLSEPWIQALAGDADRLDLLAAFMAYLIDENRRHNLTAIRDPEAIARLHFADSLAPLKLLPWFPLSRKAADIGSGAGFPIVPLAICMRDCRWLAIESVNKKANFIQQAAQRLSIENIQVLAQRAENVAHSEQRGTFDVVTARAVGAFASLCEIGLPLLRMGGHLVLYKTQASLPEAERTRQVLPQLGGRLLDPVCYRLEGDRQDRVLFVVQRVGEIPARFPRSHAKPFKQPLA